MENNPIPVAALESKAVQYVVGTLCIIGLIAYVSKKLDKANLNEVLPNKEEEALAP